MKKIIIYDSKPYLHDYASCKFLEPLYRYGKEKGLDIEFTESLDNIKNSIVLAFCGYFNPAVITMLKENQNTIASIDVTDSTWLSATYFYEKDFCKQIDLFFKFSGVPKVQFSEELQISEDLAYTKKRTDYLNDVDWEFFCSLKDKIVPMPHIPWPTFNITPIHFSKKQNVLVRGSNHYLRYHLFLNLLKHNLTSRWSGFFVADYFKESMAEEHRFCPECIATWNQYGKIPYEVYKKTLFHEKCNNQYLIWPITDEMTFQNHNNHRWNCKCIPMYYWLTEMFMYKYGSLNMQAVEDAFSIFYMHSSDFGNVLAHHLFYADYKWLYSIDIPPRFWECSAAKTVSLMPKWTANNQHFPDLIENEHYIAFDEAFDGIENVMNISSEQYDHITNNCYLLYQEWIKGEQYGISTNLMDYMFRNMEEKC